MIFSSLKLNDSETIYTQIEKHIYRSIQNGELFRGSKLPSTREVSQVMGISRNSVIAAYENLESRGFVRSIKGKGTYVIGEEQQEEKPLYMNWYSRRNQYSKTCEEMDIIKTEPKYEKGMISFKSIAPEEKFFDVEEFKRSFLEVMALEGEKLLNYGYAKGYRGLIEYLMSYMEKKGVESTHKDILITNGFTEGLDIILSSLTSPGDVIFCEAPTHHTALKLMKAYGLKVVGIPMDEQGMNIESLEEALKHYTPSFIYLIPSYHNPTGIVMSGERRRQVYDMLNQYKIPIIEDGFNEELLYSSTHIMPIASLAKQSNHVIYIGSLSKILFPGLRIGWIMADQKLIYMLESVKRAKNIHTSFLDQAAFLHYMKSGAFERYVKKVRKHYRDKYLFTLEQIKVHIPYESLWGEGGLHIFLHLREEINTRELLESCHKRGVIFMPGDLFYPNATNHTSMRIGFARLSEQEIQEGIRIIGEEIHKIPLEKQT